MRHVFPGDRTARQRTRDACVDFWYDQEMYRDRTGPGLRFQECMNKGECHKGLFTDDVEGG